jgi:hypothetical protein
MKKHLQNDHIKEFNKYKAMVKAKDGGVVENQKSKKQKGLPPSSINELFGGGTNYFRKYHVQLKFIKDFVFHVCNGYQNISIVESSWLKRLVMKRDPRVQTN